MALAQEHHGKRRAFFSPMTSSPYPVLRSLPTNKAKLPRADKTGFGGGGSLGRKRRTQAENREPLAIGPTQRDFPKHCGSRNYTPGEVNAQEWALKHRGGTWHSTLLRHQSVFNFPNFCVLFQIEPTAFGACPEPLQNSFMGKHLSICGVTEPHAHTHASPCLGCLGVCTKALKRF